MSIDWITVAAQIANFMVLVWLLKRFLYRPILDGIDAREAGIAARMQEAGQAKAAAAATEAEYRGKVRSLQAAEAEMTETIRKKAEAERDLLLADARDRMEQEHKAWQTHLDDEAKKYTAKMQSAGAAALLSLTRKALTDLADDTLEARMAHHLIRQIKPMAADLKRAAGQAAAAVITSHEPLPPAAQKSLTSELKAQFPDVSLRFETDTEQAPGLVLRMGGAQAEWTVASYIDGLDTLISENLAMGTDPKARS
ncbi:F0F1 ATP synthase subunit delta [Roseovarius arcticus]|uniref:F0F1 ATP synthase subunit delta n=1 Tax=Roseovarius arcticus TaxID=2547404 RepID=UPI0011107BD8|nr:F0F1 ATP synthase subunit B [Roseovarius arcticus]